ncbi:MAG: NAD(P)-dependent oxidoreductase [Candidatus Marinimicrobia bacterium]|nr:NAD(P)-dependent oxidoreductase [Candidatus Neomarinimicrobiota bacterium]MCF7851379.1 NAD(P)-dependent oxidoreductase [Candidatus Neomarinimicrobiota bacterium]
MDTANNETILVTGASGFIGRHLVSALLPKFTIIAFARRTQKEAGVKSHPNLVWVLVDIMDETQFITAFKEADQAYHIDYIFHLAAYYHFGDQVDSDVYQVTNVDATRILLDLARAAKIKRFIFTSSLVASKFPENDDRVCEKSELNATFPYALTKHQGEKMVREASLDFPCTIVRLAAVYSDWCEYEPLYNFLKVWLSERWDARMIPGEGSMSIPYINVSCIITMFEKILEKSEDLDQLTIFLASSDRPVALKKLFTLATRYYYGKERTPIHIPVIIAKIGVIFRDLRGRLLGKRPFEKLWMMEYIDKQFHTDCSYTRQTLDWYPKDRHHIGRRILHLIENMKSRPDEWDRKNIDRLQRFEVNRPALTLAEEMVRRREEIVEVIYREIVDQRYKKQFPFYQGLPPEDLRWNIHVVFNNLLASVRHGDRSMMMTFARDLSQRRMEQGVSLDELCGALTIIRDTITKILYSEPRLTDIKLQVHDNIYLAIQLSMDEIKDEYEAVPR